MDESHIHQPVLLKEVIQAIRLYRDGIYVDATIGMGGHAEAILKNTNDNSQLIGIDRDQDALAYCAQRLKSYGSRVHLIHGSFSRIKDWIHQAGFVRVHAVLFDLGVSSLQFDSPRRGFSFLRPGPLDMRMDSGQKISAVNIVNYSSEQELTSLLWNNAQEQFARRIARAIVQARAKRIIQTTDELVAIIGTAVPKKYHKGRIHPATKSFQAIRMEVNQEMKQLQEALDVIAESLTNTGRLAVISFHSGEDRTVKNYLFNQSRGCVCPPHLPFCACGKKPTMRIITKKPVRPQMDEIQYNMRSRSARLRVAEKIED